MSDKLREDLEALAKFWEDAMDGDSVFAYELRSVLSAHPPEPAEEVLTCPRCEGQKYDKGSCSFCNNTGRVRIPKAEPAEGTGHPDLVSETDSWLRYGKDYRWSEGLMYYLARVKTALTAPAPEGMREALIEAKRAVYSTEELSTAQLMVGNIVDAALNSAQPPKETKG